MWQNRTLCAFALALAVTVLGCGGGGSDLPELGSVTGTVLVDGTPAPDLTVSFEPTAGGRSSIGKTDASGKYELSFNAEEKGAIVGSHRVSITSPSEAPSPSGEEPKDAIPAKYNKESTLTGEVKAGDNVIDFTISKS